MNVVISELVSAVLQVIVFTAIPFAAYLLKYKKTSGFANYIGLVKTTNRAIYLSLAGSILFLSATLALVMINKDIGKALMNPPSITGKLRHMGFNMATIVILLIIAWIKTSLAEEILFRGFIAKRLIKRLGYKTGNLLQSLIFAAVHLLLFWVLTKASPVFLVFIFLLSGLAAYYIGYIKEKAGNSSIIPGWLAHGLGNTLSYFIIAFVL